MFDLDRLIEDCRAALTGPAGHAAVREIVARTVSEPRALLAALGAPERSAIQTLHRSPELTILNVVWAPRMTIMPHDHRMWAVIGIYTGREDNLFWRRVPGGAGGRIEAAGARALGERDAMPLGRDIIHSVTNPIGRLTGALHVYGGDFFGVARSEWDPETLAEQPYDVARALRLFEDANRRWEPA
ncbi:MAG TPA: hypothetical protein VNO23_02455 [Candidatus Binatia bacterium]|nr:hypothetical protein [Candidatus Binatia bacterium]